MRRRLLLTALVALAAFIALNGAVARLARDSVPRRLLAAIDSCPDAGVVAIGNSLVAAGLDGDALSSGARSRGREVRALGAGLGGSGTVEHLLIAQRSLARLSRLKLIVYGFSDLQMTSGPERRWWRLFGNHALSFYAEPAVAARHYARSGALETAAFHALARLPVFVERGAVWARVERLRRALGSVGLPPVAEARFGRVADFAQLEPIGEQAFRTACRDAAQAESPLDGPVRELLETARARGVRVVLVSMPRSGEHRRRFFAGAEWRAYLEAVRRRALELDARVLEATDWVREDALFEDGLHLGPAGAMLFSRRLGEELASELR